MYGHLRKFIPAVASFTLGTAVNVSGVQNAALAVVLGALGMVLLAWPVWERLIAGAQAKDWRQSAATLVGEPAISLFVGSAVLTVFFQFPRHPHPPRAWDGCSYFS